MKRKFLAIGLSVILAAASLAGCGSSAAPAPAAEEAAEEAVEEEAVEEAVEETEEEAPAEEEAAEEAPAEEETAEAEAPAQIDKILFATNPEFPPFEFVTTNGVIGEFDGIDMAIAVKIGEILGCEIEMQSLEFDSLIAAIATGQIEASIAGMTVTEERKKSVDFSTPYYTATQVMIVPEDSDIASAADMDGKKITVVQGYTGQTVVENLGFPFEAFKKGTECVMELTNGNCDVVVIDSATAEKYVSDNPGLKIVQDPEAFENEEYAIAVGKGNTELLNAINYAIEQMLADGTIAELSAQYIDAE